MKHLLNKGFLHNGGVFSCLTKTMCFVTNKNASWGKLKFKCLEYIFKLWLLLLSSFHNVVYFLLKLFPALTFLKSEEGVVFVWLELVLSPEIPKLVTRTYVISLIKSERTVLQL